MREYLLILLIAAGFTYLLAGLCRRLAFRYNAVAIVRDRDVHTRPIPYFGGIAMLCGLAAALLVAGQLPWLGRFDLVAHDSRAVFIAGLVICAVGVLDDGGFNLWAGLRRLHRSQGREGRHPLHRYRRQASEQDGTDG